MSTPAETWQQAQRQVSQATAVAVLAAWRQVRLSNPQASFAAVLPALLAAVVTGQMQAASAAALYVAAVVRADGLTPAPVAAVPPQRLAGVASDGRTLQGLLTQPLLRSLYLRAQGADDLVALAGGRLSLETLVRTEVLDTGRDATQVAAALEPQIIGYERYVSMPACGRCLILAGRMYSMSSAFLRHPRCDCAMRPLTSRARRDGTEQDPRGLFAEMTREQQDRALGKDAAEVVRRGGDIGKVVNARRGMRQAGDNWTTEAARRGRPRRSPSYLLRQAGDDPERFATALERAGYL